MGAVVFRLEIQGMNPVSSEMLEFAEHLADVLSEDDARIMKEKSDASGSVCEILK